MNDKQRQKAAKELNLLDKDDILSIVAEIEGTDNLKRRQKSWKRYQVGEGNQREYVEARIKELYPTTAHKFRIGDISLVKKVIKKLAKAYKMGAIREIQGAPESDTERLNDIYKKFKFNRAFKEADKIFNRDKYVTLWLNYLNPSEALGEVEGTYTLRALAPYEHSIIQDESTGEAIIFILNYPDTSVTLQAGGSDGINQRILDSKSDSSANKRMYSLWSKDNYVKVIITTYFIDGERVNDVQYIDIPGNEKMINPIGRLPIAFLSAEMGTDLPVESNLAEQSIEWNVQFSDYRTASSAQGHGQLVIEHASNQKIKELHGGLHQAITLSQSTKEGAPRSQAYYINANPDLAGQLEALKFEIINILDEHGISSPKGISADSAQNFSSGLDRMLSEADVHDIVEENQKLFNQYLEQDVFDVFRAYEEALNNNLRGDSLTVKFPKPKVMISDKETLENIRLREELDLIEPWEKLIIIDPNLTEEEAKAKLEKILKAKTERLKQMQADLSITGEDENDDEDIDENGDN